jgi:signal transduction histidine kinase
MTKRIALAILLTVWAMLIAGGLIAYFTTRSILLADLDATLINRTLSRAAQSSPAIILGADRSVTKNDLKQTLSRPTTYPAHYEPQLIAAQFSNGPDHRLRTVTVRYFALPPDLHGDPKPLTTTTSQSTADFDALLNRLALTLTIFGLVAGLLTAAVAVRVSKAALKPLAATAEQVGSIDERKLDRRIDAAALPHELLPMAVKLNSMLARLQDAFDLRNRFLADASHELRTPVAALLTALDVALTRPREADAYRRVLESCRSDVGHLRHLVERLMEQLRSESLTHDEPPQVVDVAKLLQECADNVTPLAEVKGLKLIRSFEDAKPCRIAPGRFRSVVINLLGNAIEYNRPRGTVEISCSCNGHGLKLSVKDTGIGIAADDVPHLFEPFFRADTSRTQDAGHLGLGLSLVQAHVRAMSGTCRVQSELGVGSMFQIELPGPNDRYAT